MTVLALKLSRRANAVSSLHGQVSRAMWAALYPGRQRGRRCRSATSPTACTCRTLAGARRCARSTTATSGPTGRARCGEPRHLGSDRRRRRRRAVGDAPDAEGAADRLRAPPRGRSRPSAAASRRSSSRSCAARSSLDALTIGFARRFATYKRANLILQDIEALAALVNDPQRPVQFIFAGKAHPHDSPGKEHAAADRAADARPAVRRQDRCSSRTTTSTSAGTWCRASTSG